jgi:hypothetical protein
MARSPRTIWTIRKLALFKLEMATAPDEARSLRGPQVPDL